MFLARVRRILVVPCSAAFLATACGESPLSSPTGPTAAPGSTIDLSDRTVAASAESYGDDGITFAQEVASAPMDHQGDGGFRQLSGAVTAKGADSLTVRGTVVNVEHATLIRHGDRILTLADIQIGDRVEIRGVANATSFIASEIKLEGRAGDDEDDGGEDDRNKADAKGLISGLTGTCPVLTFTVGSTSVSTTTLTDFRGTACAAIVNGAQADAQGTRQADGSIVATKVDTKLGEHDIRGPVATLTGTCPTLTFDIGTTRVTANQHTEFKGKGCDGILNGVIVEAKGTLQSDGSIVAAKVDVGVGQDEHDVNGTVSGLTGTCPSVTFIVGSTRVTTNETTEFKDAACSAIADGARVEVEGTRLADGTIVASKVEIDDDHDDD